MKTDRQVDTSRAAVEKEAAYMRTDGYAEADIADLLMALLAEKEAAEREADIWKDAVYICAISSSVADATKWMVAYHDEQMLRRNVPSYNDKLRARAIAAEAARDASQVGSDRYEYVRTMNPQQFRNLWFRAIDDRTFDAAIDAARSAGNG